ncbi:MAG TPA: DUF5683 domain-containing protein [Candidatus Kapabacteria bacterium]|nr:DUF5683 domain-containing protein [Candidatus Kapabacteria bacterium]
MHHTNTIASLLFACLAAGAMALVDPTAASAQDTTKVTPDSVRSAVDSAAPIRPSQPPAPGYVMTKSPTVAVVLSVVPGGGQLYNEQYLKSAAFVSVASFFAVQTIRNHVRFLEKVDEVNAIPLDDTTGAAAFPKREREFYRDNRDLNAAYFIGVQILSMIDAYVGAHLFDFDVDNGEDGLSSRLYLDPERMGVGVMMRW